MKFSTCLLVLLSLIAGGIALPAVATAADKRVIIGFRQAPGPAETAAVFTRKGKIGRRFKHVRAMTASLPEEEIAKLKNNPLVAYVQEDARIQMIDPLPAEYQQSWGVSRIGGAVAHTAGQLGTGVKIAILDTGIDYTHPELSSAFRAGTSFVQDLAGGIINPDGLDDNGHGTHVAGIIAAAINQSGTLGVAPQAGLFAAKVLGGDGFGLESWIVEGVNWAIEQDVDIINLSLALTSGSPALEAASQAAWDAGILLVAAAGNSGGAVAFPAAYETVIAVGATDACDAKAVFSNFGPELELTAPGTAIVSTILGGEYRAISGTSQAAPHVAGVAALIMANGITDLNSNGLVNDEVRQKLQETSQDLGDAGKDTLFGYGLVDAAAAVGLVNTPPANLCTDPTVPPVVDPPTGPIPVADIHLLRQSRHKEDDAQQALLSGGSYTITVLNNHLTNLKLDVYQNNTLVPRLSGTLTFSRKTARGVVLTMDASAGPYQLVFTPSGKFGSSATLLFNTAGQQRSGSGLPNRKHKSLTSAQGAAPQQQGSLRSPQATGSVRPQTRMAEEAGGVKSVRTINRKGRHLP